MVDAQGVPGSGGSAQSGDVGGAVVAAAGMVAAAVQSTGSAANADVANLLETLRSMAARMAPPLAPESGPTQQGGEQDVKRGPADAGGEQDPKRLRPDPLGR